MVSLVVQAAALFGSAESPLLVWLEPGLKLETGRRPSARPSYPLPLGNDARAEKSVRPACLIWSLVIVS